MIKLAHNEVIFAVISIPCETVFIASSFMRTSFVAVTVVSDFAAFFIRFLPLKTLKIIIYEHRPQIKPNQAETEKTLFRTAKPCECLLLPSKISVSLIVKLVTPL